MSNANGSALKTAGKALLVATGAAAVGYAAKKTLEFFKAKTDLDSQEKNAGRFAVYSEMPANIRRISRFNRKKITGKPIITIKQMQTLSDGIERRAYC